MLSIKTSIVASDSEKLPFVPIHIAMFLTSVEPRLLETAPLSHAKFLPAVQSALSDSTEEISLNFLLPQST